MMAHVAEAGEASGRVLFWVEEGEAQIEPAAHAAVRFASSFNAEIETVVINHDALMRAGALKSSTLVAHPHAPPRAEKGLDRVEAVQSLLTLRHRRTVEHAARRHGVLCRHSQTVGEPIDRLAEFCLVRGPWNIVVLSPPASEATEQQVGAIFANVSGATGIVIAPKRIENPEGEIVVVIEDAERLSAMLRVAGRLKGLCGRVRMLLAVDRREDLAELEAAVRIMTTNHAGLEVVPMGPMLGVAGALDDTLRQMRPGFVIACFGGTLLPTARALTRTVSMAAAPFLLVR